MITTEGDEVQVSGAIATMQPQGMAGIGTCQDGDLSVTNEHGAGIRNTPPFENREEWGSLSGVVQSVECQRLGQPPERTLVDAFVNNPPFENREGRGSLGWDDSVSRK
jgi:hypothetical protein